MKMYLTVQVTVVLVKQKKSLFHCRCSRLQDTLFVLTWICFSISPPSSHIPDSNIKCFYKKQEGHGFEPNLRQAFLCTISILTSYLPRFPRGALGFPHLGHTAQASPHWGHRQLQRLRTDWPTNLVAQLLYFFFSLLFLSCVPLASISASAPPRFQPHPPQTCYLSPVQGKQNN